MAFVPKRLRTVPWLLALQAALAVRENYQELSARDRSRLTNLLRDSRGWPGNLTASERKELRTLIGKLQLVDVARRSAPFGGGRKRKK